jgi:hypothetical protein
MADKRRAVGLSALCQKQTSRHLFEHLVGEEQERLRKREAERLGRLEIDDEFKLDR